MVPDPRSAKDKLLDRIRWLGVMKTSDVLKWGTENFSNRADRNMRQLAKDNKVRRLSEEEKIQRFGEIKEDVWVLVGDPSDNEPAREIIGPLINGKDRPILLKQGDFLSG